MPSVQTPSPHQHYHPVVYAIRALHFVIGALMTVSVVLIWYAAIAGVKDIWLVVPLLLLSVQFVVLPLNSGNCPLGNVSSRYGDHKTLFEMVAGKKYVKYGMRNFGIFTIGGMIALLIRYAFL